MLCLSYAVGVKILINVRVVLLVGSYYFSLYRYLRTPPPYVEISLSTITNTSRDVFCCCWQSLVVNWKSSTPVVCITFCSTFFTRAIGIDVMESLDSRICLDPKIFRFRFVIPLFLWHSLTKVTLSTLD